MRRAPLCHLTSVLPQHLRRELSSVSGVCLNPRCSASEGKTEEQGSAPDMPPDLPQSKPPDNVKWRRRFQPVPGSFGGADVAGQRGTPTQQRAPRQGSTSLCQTGAQCRGPGCSITSPNQGVVPGRWFVYAKVSCRQFLEAFKTCNFCFSFLPAQMCMAGLCMLRKGGYTGKGTHKPIAVKLF